MKKSLSNMKSMDKGAVMSFIVHSADISHPTKTWELHERWTAGLVEEFFRQGDAEKERGTWNLMLLVFQRQGALTVTYIRKSGIKVWLSWTG